MMGEISAAAGQIGCMGLRSLVEKFTFWHVDVAFMVRISIAACSNVVIWWLSWLISAFL